ncbi:NAD(P)-binding protein [Pseudovirgaria hyperparasitica]|uniref:NAD(P)-binding protein n=1 Tax=Pseudovirgaria hyperparasitica TaxID=470096 RepID=A0A6A6WJQ4_9PEZI|nr:NAD(P)-binding protein [Pseudovirgaria hyperparasitica]KAF2762470.1 NAD(P)-binding protein [Pseudovirgaria hyperparasitica]
MVIVAIAGGTGGVGRTIIDAIKASGQHEAVVLSRTADAASSMKYPKLAVNYENVDELRNILQQNNVEVVISTLLLSSETVARAQLNLIRAASQTSTVKRFIPSEFYIDFNVPIPGSSHLATHQVAAEKELDLHPNLTYTLLRCGIFLDHLAMPHDPKPTHIAPFWCFVDMDAEQCVIPGDGDYPLVLSHSTDVAQYIEKLIGLPAIDWPRESLVASNRILVKDLPGIVARATGKEFKVAVDHADHIREHRITPLPSNKAIFDDPDRGDEMREVELQVMLSMLSRAHDLPGENLGEVFPGVKQTNIEEFLRAGWEIKVEGKKAETC